MKKNFLVLMLFIATYSFSQSINDYKAVIIPVKYDFLKTENQYRLQTITKLDLQKAGFEAFYANETIPATLTDRCSLLYLDVKKENAFLVTKLYLVFKNCYGATIFQSAVGKSREKEYETAYVDALNETFKSVYVLNYKYNGNTNYSSNLPISTSPVVSEVIPPTTISANSKIENEINSSENKNANLLYAQPTSYGYQLIDSEPKVIIKAYKTSNPESYMATKGSVQGVLVSKNNLWFFEYYQNDQLISEKINVRF